MLITEIGQNKDVTDKCNVELIRPLMNDKTFNLQDERKFWAKCDYNRIVIISPTYFGYTGLVVVWTGITWAAFEAEVTAKGEN